MKKKLQAMLQARCALLLLGVVFFYYMGSGVYGNDEDNWRYMTCPTEPIFIQPKESALRSDMAVCTGGGYEVCSVYDFLCMGIETLSTKTKAAAVPIRFVCYWPGQVTFYLGSSTVPDGQRGSITIDSKQFVEDDLMYAHYTPPTNTATDTLYGEHTIQIRMELDAYEKHSCDLFMTVDFGEKPQPDPNIWAVGIRPDAQVSGESSALIPGDSDCYAQINVYPGNVPDDYTPSVTFEQETGYGAFVDPSKPTINNKTLVQTCTRDEQDRWVARAYYHNTSRYYNYEEIIRATVGTHSVNRKIYVGMDAQLGEVKTFLMSTENAQFGIQPRVFLKDRPDFDIDAYIEEYSAIWAYTPGHGVDKNFTLGAQLSFAQQNLSYYNTLMNLITGPVGNCYEGYTKFVATGTNGEMVLELDLNLSKGEPFYISGGHFLPGIELTKEGTYYYLMDAKLAVHTDRQTTPTKRILNDRIVVRTNSQFCVARDDVHGWVQDLACVLDPTSREQYILFELIKNLAPPPTAWSTAFFFADIACKLAQRDFTGAIISGVTFKAGDTRDTYQKMLDKGQANATQIKRLKGLTPTLALWDYYNHAKNMWEKTNSVFVPKTDTDYCPTAWNTIDYTPPLSIFEDYEVNPPRGSIEGSVTVPATQLVPTDAEYQHLVTTFLQGWMGTNDMVDSNCVIVAASGVESADMRLDGHTRITPYDPDSFEYANVEAAMSYSLSNYAVFYMPDTNTATLTVGFTNTAAITVIHPQTDQYSVYSLPVRCASTAVLEFATGAHTNPLTLYTGTQNAQISARTHSVTGSAWVAVVLEPGAATNAGAAWTLGAGNGRMDSRIMEVSPGTYYVNYGLSDTYDAPFGYWTTAEAGKTNVLFGRYGKKGYCRQFEFKTTSEMTNWNAVSGSWHCSNQTYQSTGSKANLFALTLLENSGRSNYTFSADVCKMQGDSERTVYPYGLILRSNDALSEYYEFLITDDGRYMIARRDGADMYWLVDYTFTDALYTGYAIWNNLKIAASNDTIEFNINGQIMYTVSQAQLLDGKPGLLAIDAGDSTDPDIVRFDNISLISETQLFPTPTPTATPTVTPTPTPTPTPGPPPAPQAFRATSVSTNGFTATWRATGSSNPATNYLLDVATDISFASFVPGYSNLSVNLNTEWTVSIRNWSDSYYYRVCGQNVEGTGEYSNVIHVRLHQAGIFWLLLLLQ